MKLYDLVKELLEENPKRRDSDKMLMFAVWYRLGFIENKGLSFESFMQRRCPTPESITRCRRKIQENLPSLRSSKAVEAERRKKETEKGTFIYREQV